MRGNTMIILQTGFPRFEEAVWWHQSSNEESVNTIMFLLGCRAAFLSCSCLPLPFRVMGHDLSASHSTIGLLLAVHKQFIYFSWRCCRALRWVITAREVWPYLRQVGSNLFIQESGGPRNIGRFCSHCPQFGYPLHFGNEGVFICLDREI